MQNRQSLFYVSSLPLGLGSVIEPGNWGRIVNHYQPAQPNGMGIGNPWLLARELAFENVRAAGYNQLPSRLSSNFLFTSLDIATSNASEIGDGRLAKRLYRAEIIDLDAPTHIGDFAGINVPNSEFLPWAIRAAHAYWSTGPKQVEELLTTSPIRLVELVIGDPPYFQPRAVG